MMFFGAILGALAAVNLVQALPASVDAESLSPDDAVASYSALSNGTVTTNTGAGAVLLGTWRLVGASADYEIRYSPTGDTGSLTGAAINSWLGLGTTRTWTLTDSGPAGGPLSVSGLMEIRLASSGTVLSSATVSMSAWESF